MKGRTMVYFHGTTMYESIVVLWLNQGHGFTMVVP